MKHIYPDYYENFRCIADKCVHNCCIGWEIDIDEDTASMYRQTEGDLGNRLRDNIDFSADSPCFILAQDERCPFLNSKNLCDIITAMGEESLCTICSEHPRFHNELPLRIESGLGMCCEEAARIILTKKDKVTLVSETGDSQETDDEIIKFRDELLSLVQNREMSIDERAEAILCACNAQLPPYSWGEWAEILLSYEQLDGNWTQLLNLLRDKGDNSKAGTDALRFDKFMDENQTEYENLLHYFIYRHVANAPDMDEAGVRAAFAVFAYRLIHILHTLLWAEKESLTAEERTDVCRMFSAEIEYSDENLYALFDEFY